MPFGPIHAFIDESGQRAKTSRCSDHFVMSAALVRASNLSAVTDLLATLRTEIHRNAGHHLSWKNLNAGHRLAAAERIGGESGLRLCSVVVCKRYLAGTMPSDHHAYLYTLRFLLERLSWFGKAHAGVVSYTLAHISRFKLAQLREYEANLRASDDCWIDWDFLDPRGGRIDQPQTYEPLQLGDLTASAIGEAFDPTRGERVYLERIAPRFWRGNTDKLTSYGLKLHPYSDATKAAYPWVAAL